MALEHGEHSITVADHGEVFSFLHVVLLGPVQGEFHRVDELLVVECVLGVTRYIESVQLCQQFHELLVIHPVIDRDDAGTTGL